MQPALRATVQEIGGPRRPFRFAEIACLALIKVSAEVASKICAGPGRTEKFACARAIQPHAMTEQGLGKIGIVALQVRDEIGEGSDKITSGKRFCRGPAAWH